MQIIKKPKKKITLYKVLDQNNKWITLSFKAYGPVVLTSNMGGKIYASTSSFQNILKKFILASKLRGSIKYGEEKIPSSEFYDRMYNWKIVPFIQQDSLDMIFFADSFKNENI